MSVVTLLEAGHPVQEKQINPVFQRFQVEKLHVEDTQEAREGMLNLTQIKNFVEDLIDKSYDSWKTTKYDEFQFKSNNILK